MGRFTRLFHKGEGWREQRNPKPLRDRGCPTTGAEAPSWETGETRETRLEESWGQGGLRLEQARSQELRCQKELWKNLRSWLQTPASICLTTVGCVTLCRLLTLSGPQHPLGPDGDSHYLCCHQAVGGQEG